MLDPQLGGCRVAIPTNSPMNDAGSDGSDIGANIIFQLLDGTPTEKKLWDQKSGAFPCGETVIGLNDRSLPSCATVHERLNVGPGGGCPLPN